MRTTHTQSATYTVGDMLTLKSGAIWRIDRISPRDDGRVSIGLDDPANPGKHSTAFYSDRLDAEVVRHIPVNDHDTELLISRLAADIARALPSFPDPRRTRELAAKLVELGWKR